MKSILSLVCLLTFVSFLSATRQDDALNHVKNYYKKLQLRNGVSQSFMCNECRSTITEMKSTLSDEAKFNKLKNVIKLGCNFLNDQSIEECKRTVDILDLYRDKLQFMLDDPNYSCQQMLLCGSNVESPIGNKVLIMGMKALLKSTSTAKLETEQCDECVLVINTLYAILADGGVQTVLKYVANKVCIHIKALSSECGPLLDHYFPIAMAKIETYLSDPYQVCTTFFVCRSSNRWQDVLQHKVPLKTVYGINRHHHLQRTLSTLPRLQTKSGDDAGCLACTISITSIIAILNQPFILNETTYGLITLVCTKIMPSSITPSCNDFMGYYLKAVLEMTINNWTPDQICTKFKACNATSLQSFKAMTVQDQSTTACEACQTITNFLNTEFQQQSFQQEVLSFVKSLVCTHSSTTEAQCSSMVDQYVPVLMQYICDYLSRNTFCLALHICPAT